LISDGISAGEFRDVDPRQTAFTMLGATAFYFASAPVMGPIVGHDLLATHALEARRRALLDFIEHGLYRTYPKRSRKSSSPARSR
jgi:Tetracyclin repressor-like, C-terminal domain